MGTERQTWAVILGAGVLFLLPPLVLLLAGGVTRAFTFLAGDVFYYLTVARNTVELGRVSFDQVHPTNGFQPLWQCIVILMYLPVHLLGLGNGAAYVLLALVSLLSTTAAITVFGVVLRDSGRLTTLFLLAPVGVYALFWILLDPRTGTLWRYADGMESSLVLLAYGALALWFVRATEHINLRRSLILAALCLFFALSRLDHALFLPALLGGMFLHCLLQRRFGEALRMCLAAGLAAAGLALYLGLNRWYAGAFLPTSGIVKSTFPVVCMDNLRILKEILSGERALDFQGNDMYLWRIGQVIVPLLVAGPVAAWTTLRLRRPRPGLSLFLGFSAGGVLLLHLYNLLYVPWMSQGTWYVPASVAFLSLLAYASLGRQWTRRHAIPVAIAGVAVNIVVFWTFIHRPDNRLFLGLEQQQVAAVRGHYGEEEIRLLELQDGLWGFTSGYPCMNMMLYCGDVEAVRRVAAYEPVLEIALERGYDRIPIILSPALQLLRPGMPQEEIREVLRNNTGLTASILLMGQAPRVGFELDFLDLESQVAVVKMFWLTPSGAP